jgi:hypothetical protein
MDDVLAEEGRGVRRAPAHGAERLVELHGDGTGERAESGHVDVVALALDEDLGLPVRARVEAYRSACRRTSVFGIADTCSP